MGKAAERPGPLYNQLRPRPKGPAAARVLADQRARLYGAMIEAVAVRGYGSVTVDEVVALAGVSTKALYRCFGSKQECFLATLDEIAEDTAASMVWAYLDGRGCREGLRRATETWACEITERPRAARLLLLDAYAAGPAGAARLARAQTLFAELLGHSLLQAASSSRTATVPIRSIVSGLWHVARVSVLEDRTCELVAGYEQLVDWMLAYRPSPRLLARPGDSKHKSPSARVPMSDLGKAIADFELLSARALAHVRREVQGTRGWEASVHATVRSLLNHLANEPRFAHLAFVEIMAVGPEGVARLAHMLHRLAAFLVRQPSWPAAYSPLVAEAIVGAVWGLICDQLTCGDRHSLPALASQAASLVLAPGVGGRSAVTQPASRRLAVPAGK